MALLLVLTLTSLTMKRLFKTLTSREEARIARAQNPPPAQSRRRYSRLFQDARHLYGERLYSSAMRSQDSPNQN